MPRPPLADLALRRLADGPADATTIATALIDRVAVDPTSADAEIRAALGRDPRVACLPDSRFVSLSQALEGAYLTTRLRVAHLALGEIPIDGELAPLMAAGLETGPAPPPGAGPGDLVAVRVVGLAPLRLQVERLRATPDRPVVRAAVEAALGRESEGDGLPIHLATVGLTAMADNPVVFRRPGPPLGEVIGELGLELRFGWVAPPGSDWSALAELEAGLLADAVDEHLTLGAPDAAVRAQERLVSLLESALPGQYPMALQRLQGLRADAEDGGGASAARHPARLPVGDADDHYRAVRSTLARGDLVAARRLVESGLARAADPASMVALSLADIGHDLDCQAALARIPLDAPSWWADPVRTTGQVLELGRSYLVERLADGLVARNGAEAVIEIIGMLATGDTPRRDVAAGLSVVLPGHLRVLTRRLRAEAGADVPAIHALLHAAPTAAWRTVGGGDHERIIVAIGKEEGRVMPFVADLVASDVGQVVAEAAFAPDLAACRFRYEVLDASAAELRPLPVQDATAILEDAVGLAVAMRMRTSQGHDRHLLDRIERWLLRPFPGA